MTYAEASQLIEKAAREHGADPATVREAKELALARILKLRVGR